MNAKKFLAMILALTMAISLTVPAWAVEAVESPWYAKAQQYVTEKGIMTGTDKGFEPEGTLTRAQVVQTLYNMAGKPTEGIEKAAFNDIDGKWYSAAAHWASFVGFVEGKADGSFGGDEIIARAETAQLMADYAKSKGLVANTEGMAMKEASDYETIPAEYLDGMTFCYYGGVMKGDEAGKLNPAGQLTRAEMAMILQNFSALKPYIFDAEKPYNSVTVGLFHNIKIAVDEQSGLATYYLPKEMQPYASAVIVLTPDNTTAEAFSTSATGLAWQAVADAKKIAVAFLEPDQGKTWNLSLAKDGRDDAAVLNQLYRTMRSRNVSNVAPFSVNRGHIALSGYGEGGAAALLFGSRYATNFSGIAAVNATAVSAQSLKTVGELAVQPFLNDGSTSGEELGVKAKTVDMPVWFVNSSKDNKAVVDYFIAANDAKKTTANKTAETVYQAANSDARIWVSAKEQTPETIYNEFLGGVKRLRGMQEGGRVSFTNDYTKPQYKMHEETVNGELRRWITYVPSTYTGNKEVPMVLVMHGYGASLYGIAEESRWYDLAEKNGFIVIFAQALVREGGTDIPSTAWIADSFAARFPDKGPLTDVNFINSMLDKTEAEYKIDKTRVYATGHSNGSMMTWDLGVRATQRFAAIAPVGFMVTPTAELSADVLLPTWSFMGEYDSPGTPALVAGNGTVAALQAWNAINGTNESKVAESKQFDGSFVTKSFPNADGVPLVRYTVSMNTPHVYIQEQSQVIWSDFFAKYSRGDDGTLYYEGKAVKASDYVAADGWYSAAPKQ